VPANRCRAHVSNQARTWSAVTAVRRRPAATRTGPAPRPATARRRRPRRERWSLLVL